MIQVQHFRNPLDLFQIWEGDTLQANKINDEQGDKSLPLLWRTNLTSYSQLNELSTAQGFLLVGDSRRSLTELLKKPVRSEIIFFSTEESLQWCSYFFIILMQKYRPAASRLISLTVVIVYKFEVAFLTLFFYLLLWFFKIAAEWVCIISSTNIFQSWETEYQNAKTETEKRKSNYFDLNSLCIIRLFNFSIYQVKL